MQTQLVYQCKNCKTILSDSLHGEGVTLPKDESSQAIYVKQANVEQPEDGRPQINEETFSVSMALVCVSCKSHVGHRLISTSSDLDHLRGFLSLDGSVSVMAASQS
jgi:DNA-directed RNA polymerase subunit RPC12/RpoP